LTLNDHLRAVSDILNDFTSALNRIESLLRMKMSGSGEDTAVAVRQFIRKHDRTPEQVREKLDYLESNWIALARDTDPNELIARKDLINQLSWAQAARSPESLDLLDHAIFLWPTEKEPADKHLANAVSDLKEVVSRWRSEWSPGVLSRLLGLAHMEESAHQKQRRANLADIKSLGIEPYPHKFERTHTIFEVVEEFGTRKPGEFETERVDVRVAGRVHAINKMGKSKFVRFSDGRKLLQVYIRSNEVDERTWSLLKLLDLGDIIGTEGRLFHTKTGELSIHAESLVFLAKALLPPPDKHYGLHDVETRYRQRYADLIANSRVRSVFEKRSQTISRIRKFFDENGYIEVETPMLTPLPTGAAARPFKTHHNALRIELYARIAPELYLKRLIVGGFEKVYEINRNFRNEGTDRSHNPEFTMLEWYQAYSEYDDLIRMTEELIWDLVEHVCEKEDFAFTFTDGNTKRVWPYGEHQIDFTRPWKRLTMREAVIHYWPGQGERPTIEDLSSSEGILRWAGQNENLIGVLPTLRLSQPQKWDYGHLLGEVFEHVTEAKLINPTFITEFPTELSPLSKQNQDDPRFVDRFELFIAGMEIANAFCEINDPVDQRQRFEAQMKLREGGDDEAMVIDNDYIRALSYGMPPTAGEGVGIDRLVMILTNQHSIRDVILFPHMRPEKPVVSGQLSVTSRSRSEDDDSDH
jgi:lysyl-tRNA synthetase, class II